MQLRSDAIKRGLARAPHRSLLKADGLTDEELTAYFGPCPENPDK